MWVSLIPQILVVSALLFVPGLLITAAAGLPPRTAVSIAPAVSIGVIAGAGVVAPLVRVPWGPVLVAALVAVTVIVTGLVRLVLTRVRGRAASDPRSRGRPTPADALLFLVLLGVSALIMTWLMARELNTPDAISQTFDAVFHLNAVEWILRTGNASSVTCHLESPEGSFYPMGWHTLVALTMKLTGSTSIPLATNATAIAVSALVWPSGCLALTSRILDGRRLAMVATALLCTATTAFPLLLLSFGVLYPNFLALCLLPGMIASLLDLFPARDEPSPPPLLIPAIVVALGGLGLAQPNVIVTFLVALSILLVAWVMRAVTGAGQDGPAHQARRLRYRIITCLALEPAIIGLWIALRPPQKIMAQLAPIVGLLVALSILLVAWVMVMGVVTGAGQDGPAHQARRLRYRIITCLALEPAIIGLWIALRPPQDAATWGPNNFMSAVIGEILTSSPQGLPIAWVVAVPAIVGAVAAWRRPRLRWLLVLHAIDCALYVVSKTTPMEGAAKDLRYWLVGTWYSDTFRLSALFPLTTIPLAALGACVIADWAARRYPALRLREARGARRRVAYGVLVTALVLLGPASPPTSQALHKLEEPYTMKDDSPLLTPDELALIKRLPGLVGEDEIVAVDPNSGSALAYALAGTDTTVKHIFYHNTPDLEIINDRLRFVATDPRVCKALDDLGVRYVLYFPGRMVRGKHGLDGFVSLSAVDGFQLVSRQGRAALYRVTACG